MNSPGLHAVPSLSAVAAEQVRVVGLAVRREVAAFAAILAVLVVSAVVVGLSPSLQLQIDADVGLALNPEELGYLAWVVGLAFPLVVWKGEAPWGGDALLWTLPVARPRHALIKVAAGWVWLMAVIALGLASLAAMAVATGGTLGIDVVRFVGLDPGAGPAGAVAATWTTPGWQWLVPFPVATAVYLAATAVWLGTAHPWRWLVVAWVSILAFGGLLERGVLTGLEGPLEAVARSLDHLLTGGTESLRLGARRPDGEWFRIWSTLPSAGRWLGHSSLWLGVGVAAVVAAARRHREG